MTDSTRPELLALAAELTPAHFGSGMDLSDEGMLGFLMRKHPLVRTAMDRVESKERWAGDQNFQIVDMLADLGRELSPEVLAHMGAEPTAELIQLLGFIRFTRCLMLFERLIDEAGERSEAALWSKGKAVCAGNEEAMLAFRFLVNRFLFMQRTELIQRVYSPQRANRLIEGLKAVSTP